MPSPQLVVCMDNAMECARDDDDWNLTTNMCLQCHVMSHMIGQVMAGEWPEATTPCAPLEKGNALVAYNLLTNEG